MEETTKEMQHSEVFPSSFLVLEQKLYLFLLLKIEFVHKLKCGSGSHM